MQLSVIVPGFNTPHWMWRRCLKSVLNAIGHDDEIICVDDGSIVPVASFWQELGIEDPRVRLITLPNNKGLPTARNEGLKVATGLYFACVDSDDEVLPDAFDVSIRQLEETGADIAVFGVRPVWVNNGLYKEDVLPQENLGRLTAEGLVRVFKACLFDYAWNKVYRRSFLDEHHLRFDKRARTGEDTIFNCACVVAGAKWCTVNRIGIIYYRYDGTMLSRYVPNMRETHRLKLQARAACRVACPGADELLGGRVEISESALDCVEWMNMWKWQSPVSLRDRWRFLSAHASVSSKCRIVEFASRLLFGFMRKYFYIRPIRRWQVKRLFQNVKEYT